MAARPPLMVDGDADGVSDDIDECPYTPPGVRVNAVGCPLKADDADADGVADQNDDCPYTPAGAVVDAHGCAIDGDLDGVADGIDRCPHTPLGLRVDAQGCAPGEIATAVMAPPRRTPMPPATNRREGADAVACRPPAETATIDHRPSGRPPISEKTAGESTMSTVPLAAAPSAPPAGPASFAGVTQTPSSESTLTTFRFVPTTATVRPDERATFAQASVVLRQALQQDAAAFVVLKVYVRDSEPHARTLLSERVLAIRQVLQARGIAAGRVHISTHWLTPSLPGTPRFEISLRQH